MLLKDLGARQLFTIDRVDDTNTIWRKMYDAATLTHDVVRVIPAYVRFGEEFVDADLFYRTEYFPPDVEVTPVKVKIIPVTYKIKIAPVA